MTSTEQVLGWLCRDHVSFEHWKSVADVFFLSAVSHPFGTSESTKARRRLSEHFRYLFESFAPETLDVGRWSSDFSGIETVHVECPDCSSDPVNWEFIADYFLQHLAGDSTILDDLNSDRTELQNKLDERLEANKKRAISHFEKTVAFMVENGVQLPQKRMKSGVDIRARLKFIEEEKSNDTPKKIVLPQITPYERLK